MPASITIARRVEAERRRKEQADAGQRPDAREHADQRSHDAADDRVEQDGGRQRDREPEGEIGEGLGHQRPSGPRGSGTRSNVSKRTKAPAANAIDSTAVKSAPRRSTTRSRNASESAMVSRKPIRSSASAAKAQTTKIATASVHSVQPTLASAGALPAHTTRERAEAHEHDRERNRHVCGAGMAEAAERQAPALEEDDQREQDEGAARNPLGRQHRRRAASPSPLARARSSRE